jgi:hypothetical protein
VGVSDWASAGTVIDTPDAAAKPAAIVPLVKERLVAFIEVPFVSAKNWFFPPAPRADGRQSMDLTIAPLTQS